MRVEVSAKVLSFPRFCVCCGAEPDHEVAIWASRSSGTRVVRIQSMTWSVPTCARCVAHSTTWPDAMGGDGWLLGLLTCGAYWVFHYLRSQSQQAKARAMLSPNCACPWRAASLMGWDGTHQVFDFAAPGYAIAFAEANSGKLLNVSSELRAGLAARRHAQLEEATARLEHARQAREALEAALWDEEGECLRVLARVQSARTPAARRTAVRAGLGTLRSIEAKQRIVLESSKLDVEQALEKADKLKTKAAKRRVLSEMLDEIRNDDIPDELQVKQIAWLRQALDELDAQPTMDLRSGPRFPKT